MTGTDLRSAIDEELRDLEPMPSVLPEVLAEGRRRQRRCGRVIVGAAAAAVIGVVAVATTTVDNDSTAPVPPAPDVNPATPAEFGHWSAERFDAVLPDRFADLRPAGRAWDYVYGTEVGGRRIEVTFGATYAKPPMAYPPKCERPPFPPRHSCVERPGFDALAEHYVDGRNRGYAVLSMEVSAGAKRIDLGLQFTAERGADVPISGQRLLAIARTPEFEEIWREYAEHPAWWTGIAGG